MTKRLVRRRSVLLAAVGTVVLLAVVAVPVAAGGNGHGHGHGNSNNRLLAAGIATERLGGGVQWHIQFQIHARNNGKSSKVSVQTPTSTFSYIGSVCSGSYTTAAGTTVYVVGRQTSFTGTGFERAVPRLLDPQGRADGSRLLVGLVVCFSGSRPGRLREPGSLASDAVRARRCLRSVQGLTRGSRNGGTGGAAAAPLFPFWPGPRVARTRSRSAEYSKLVGSCRSGCMPASVSSSASGWRGSVAPVRGGVLRREELRYAHRPGAFDQVAHLFQVDPVEPHMQPVEAQVGFAGQ